MTPLDPTTEAAALPGSLVASNSSVLLPVTFAEFTLRDSTGNRLNLKSSASATVELPIPAALRSAYPLASKIHCYSYDATTGKWADFVDGTVQVSSVDGTSPVLAASIRHFSWYGGAPEGNDCVDVYVKVTSAVDGKPLGNARVEATPGTVAYTDANGEASVRSAVGPTPSEFTAYQTGIDVDGSLTGTAGAKYIEFGRVDVELVGLVTKACSEPAGGGQPSGTGSSGSPIGISIGVVKGVYQAVAVLGTGGGQGTLSVYLVQGVPGPGGELENPVPADGAKVYVSAQGGTPVMLTFAGQGTGVYYSPSTFPITAGQTYTLSIDADGNGSIDGSGTASALGDFAFASPAEGADLTASGFVAIWTDSASGNAGYAPYYEVVIAGAGATSDFAFYIGTDRQWTVLNPQGATLAAGGLLGESDRLRRRVHRGRADHLGEQQHHGRGRDRAVLQLQQQRDAGVVHASLSSGAREVRRSLRPLQVVEQAWPVGGAGKDGPSRAGARRASGSSLRRRRWRAVVLQRDIAPA